MRRQVSSKKYKVPYLLPKVIEEHAQLVLDEWAQQHSPVVEPPVPVDDILEFHLELVYFFDDLQAALGHRDVLGGIWFGDRMIKVDQSLDPTNTPKMLGRYRFTLAHEIGHWRLHRKYLAEDPSAAHLFESECEPAFVCRSSLTPPEEKQANAFAAALLMPRRMVFDAWMQWRGSDAPVGISDLPACNYYSDSESNTKMAMELFCKPLAVRFEVSAEAMSYRLRELELLVKEVQPRLF